MGDDPELASGLYDLGEDTERAMMMDLQTHLISIAQPDLHGKPRRGSN